MTFSMGHICNNVTNIQVVFRYFRIQDIFDVITFHDVWSINVMTIHVSPHNSQLDVTTIHDNFTHWELVR